MSRLPMAAQGVVLGMHHVQLGFAPQQQVLMKQFYGQWLGLPQLVAMDAGTSQALAYGAGGLRIDLVPRQAAQHVCESQGHVALQVAGIGALHQRLSDHGVTALAIAQIDEGLRFYVKDPAGNTLELLQPHAATAPVAQAAGIAGLDEA